MASINRIPSVYISTDQEAFTIVCSERVSLVGTGMCPQHSFLIDIVCVCFAPSGVVERETQGVKVLMRCNNWEILVVVFVGW